MEDKKDIFLQQFKRERQQAKELFSKESVDLADELVSLIKTKELTYEETYVALELAYNQLKYESNFIRLELVK